MITDDFLMGAIALKKSLDKVSKLPLSAMCLNVSHQTMKVLQKNKIIPLPIEPIKNPQNGTHRFFHTYAKLRAFSLTQFEKIVFIDSDAIVLQNVDDLFEYDKFAAAPDHGITLNNRRFNSGVFVVVPSDKLFGDILSKIKVIRSPDSSDQGFLNVYFKDRWQALPYTYNTLKRLYVHNPKMFNLNTIKILHFVGTKPWQNGTDSLQYRKLNELWRQYYDD